MAPTYPIPRLALALALAVALLAVAVPSASADPDNRIAPSISGGETAQEGQPVSADEGEWDAPPGATITYTYAWQRCNTAGAACVAIPGATGKNYVPTTTDVRSRLRVRVVADCNVFLFCSPSSALSAPSSLVDPDPVNEERPSIDGLARRGQTLVANPGFWRSPAPLSFGYQWLRCDRGGAGCQPIPGATNTSLKLGRADVGRTIRVTVGATNARPRSATAQSGATPVVGKARRTRVSLLSPFPSVTLAGVLSSSGARVTRFTVRGPRGANVKILCKGRGCPFKTRRFAMKKRSTRIRALERRLRSGTVLRLTVTRPGFIGKYSRIRIRSNAAPKRSDLCLRPGARKPTRCPRR